MDDLTTPYRYNPGPGTTETLSITVGGWAYEDEEQQEFALTCGFWCFYWPSYDDFIDGLPECEAKQELLGWRQQAFKAFKSRNESALKGWLQALHVNRAYSLYRGDSQPLISVGLTYSESQSIKGKKGAEKRWAISDDGDSELKLTSIIENIALSPEHEDWKTKELWPALYAELDRLHLDPKEQIDSDPRKSSITYGGKREITFGRFANAISEQRSKKKSR